MSKSNNKKVVIALGGSIAFPEEINTSFLEKFSFLIKKKTAQGYKFVIVVGGGEIARKYQEASSSMGQISEENKDWLGIYATRLNAYFLKSIFGQKAASKIFNERGKIKSFGKRSVVIGSGWKAGWSTDFVSAQIAVDFNIEKVIFLGKPSHILVPPESLKERKIETLENHSPAYYDSAQLKPASKISWSDYLSIIPSEWTPGLQVPIDPVGAKLAKKEGLTGIVASGKDLDNFENILKGKKFRGTVVY